MVRRGERRLQDFIQAADAVGIFRMARPPDVHGCSILVSMKKADVNERP
jgi:hypothetical protein